MKTKLRLFEELQPFVRTWAFAILKKYRCSLSMTNDDITQTAYEVLWKCLGRYQTPNKALVRRAIMNYCFTLIARKDKFANNPILADTGQVAPVPEIYFDLNKIRNIEMLAAFSVGIPVRRIKGATAYKINKVKEDIEGVLIQ